MKPRQLRARSASLPAPKAVPKSDPVQEAARNAFRLADGDAVQAVRLMTNMVQQDQDLRERLLAPLIQSACSDAIRRVCRELKQVVWHVPATPAQLQHQAERVKALAASNEEMLADWRLPLAGSPRIHDSTGAAILEAAEWYRSRAEPFNFRDRWLRKIAACITPDTTPADHGMTETEYRSLQDEARDA